MEEKKLLYPESELSVYFNRGSLVEPIAMTQRLVKRTYYSWLKNGEDTRDFEQVFRERRDRHIKDSIKKQKAREKQGTLITTGKVIISDNKVVFINSPLHMPLTIYRGKGSTVSRIVKGYCKSHFCEIDLRQLLLKNLAKIKTRVKQTKIA